MEGALTPTRLATQAPLDLRHLSPSQAQGHGQLVPDRRAAPDGTDRSAV